MLITIKLYGNYYHKVLDGKMIEQEFIELSGKLQLGILKLNNIINEMNSI